MTNVMEEKILIVNKLGLHARAAAKLVNIASAFASEIKLEYRDQEVDAKSIMGIMMLAAAQGATVIVRTQGEDATTAMRAVCELFNDRFGEPE